MERSLGGVRRKKSGFTLLELIIVLVVLAALAAMVIPLLGWVRDQAKFATASAAAAELVNNLELYKASTGKYPDRMDSLVDSTGAVYAKSYPGGSGAALATVIDGSSAAYYYLNNGAGVTSVMQHSTTATDPSASTDGVAPTPLDSSAKLLAFNAAATSDPNFGSKAKRILAAAYPNQSTTTPTLPSGHQLVIFGVGSRSANVGSTMTSAPLNQTGQDAGIYARYYAVFDLSPGPTGRGKVQLKMVLDSEFEVVAKNLANFKGAGPTDDAGAVAATTGP